jgi:hypothetical protein
MRSHILIYMSLSLTSLVAGQEDVVDLGFTGPAFQFTCPERNGLFADEEQCDLYYICENNVARPELCEDGMLFDDRIRNREKCVLPQGVNCGKREFVQKPTPGIDPQCERANGFFEHNDPTVCDKFFLCDKGNAHEMPCSAPLFFDVHIGSCVREENLSPEAKTCKGVDAPLLKTIEGFTCPGRETIGPHGLLQAHPVFPHPSDCQFFFTCFFGKEPNKFGCSKGQVFDANTLICKEPLDVPECGCWYDCGEDSNCPGTCNADCTCPGAEEDF